MYYYDLNGDGVKEFMTEGNIYSYVNNKVHPFFTFDETFTMGNRAQWYLHKGGIIEVEGLCGADCEGYDFYKIKSDGTGLTKIGSVLYNRNYNSENYEVEYDDGTSVTVNDIDEMYALIKKYAKETAGIEPYMTNTSSSTVIDLSAYSINK